MLTSNKCKNPWAMIQHYIYCHDEWSSLYVHYDLEIEETYLCRIYASVKLPLRKLFNNVLLLRFCFVFFFSFSFFHDNYRWQKPDGLQFTENYMIIVVCEWISVWDILLYELLFSSKKKYSFPIFGWIPAWRNGSWFRTYLIGFSQEEINERRRMSNGWWVGYPKPQMWNGLNSNWS